MHSVDPLELEKFNQLAHDWWNPSGVFRTLHDINPLRLSYIQRFTSLAGQRVLDVGCGGGILSESLAAQGARVTGIDLSTTSIAVAKQHAQKMAIPIDYECIAVEAWQARSSTVLDIVICMEMLEHTKQPEAIVKACAHLVKPQGWVFFSTINRNLSAYLGAVIVAEYLLALLPRGTHNYQRFITPAELMRMVRHTKCLTLQDISGMVYDPFRRLARLTPRPLVNYLMALQKN